MQLIKAAASLFRNDIASLGASKDKYPDTESIRNHLNFVLQSLREFLQNVTHRDCGLEISAIDMLSLSLVGQIPLLPKCSLH